MPNTYRKYTYHEVTVEYRVLQKVIVAVPASVDQDEVEVWAMEEYTKTSGAAFDKAMGRLYTDDGVCDHETIDCQVEAVPACSRCDGTGQDEVYERNPCMACDGNGFDYDNGGY